MINHKGGDSPLKCINTQNSTSMSAGVVETAFEVELNKQYKVKINRSDLDLIRFIIHLANSSLYEDFLVLSQYTKRRTMSLRFEFNKQMIVLLPQFQHSMMNIRNDPF